MDNLTFFDSIAEKWDEIAIHNKNKVDFIVKSACIESNNRVLDLGSGTGVLIPFIKTYIGIHGKIVALDISSKMLELAKKKNGTDQVDYICTDFLKYQCDYKFQVIMAYSCFPHFLDDKAFFRKCDELLVEKGRLVIAHSESKEMINASHKNLNGEVISGILKDTIEVIKIANEAGFEEKIKIQMMKYI